MLNQPIILALLATMGTWGMTAIGAAFVFFFKTINRHVMNGMLGFASGVMIAASFWSLLNRRLNLRKEDRFLLGGCRNRFSRRRSVPLAQRPLDSTRSPGLETGRNRRNSNQPSPLDPVGPSYHLAQYPRRPRRRRGDRSRGGGKRIPDDDWSVDRGDRNRLAEPPRRGGGFRPLAKRGAFPQNELLL